MEEEKAGSILFEGATFNGTELTYHFRVLNPEDEAGQKGEPMQFAENKHMKRLTAGCVYSVVYSENGIYANTLKFKHRYYSLNEIEQVRLDHELAVKAMAAFKAAKNLKFTKLDKALSTLADAYWATNARGREQLLAHIIRKITKG